MPDLPKLALSVLIACAFTWLLDRGLHTYWDWKLGRAMRRLGTKRKSGAQPFPRKNCAFVVSVDEIEVRCSHRDGSLERVLGGTRACRCGDDRRWALRPRHLLAVAIEFRRVCRPAGSARSSGVARAIAGPAELRSPELYPRPRKYREGLLSSVAAQSRCNEREDSLIG